MPIWIFFYYLNIYYEKFRDPIYLPLVGTFPLANKETAPCQNSAFVNFRDS